MTGDWIPEEHVFQFRPTTDIVYNLWGIGCGVVFVGYNSDMGQISGKHPGYEVSRGIIPGIIRYA